MKDIAATNNYNWPSKLDDYLDSYNNSYHSSVKMTPNEVNKRYMEAYNNIINNARHTGENYYDLDVGDNVRVKINKSKLDKHSTQNWSDIIYTIDKIVQPRSPYASTKYFIEGSKVAYSHNDLQKVTKTSKPPQSIKYVPEGEYEVDKITNKKKIKGAMYYEVYWRGYDDPTWEPYRNIKDTKAYQIYIKKK